MVLSADLRAGLAAAGQGHAVARCDLLAVDDEAAAERLARDLAALDLELLTDLFRRTKELPAAGTSFEPPELVSAVDAADGERFERARSVGAGLLAAGKVGFLLVAGGQGSRLGFEAPKGDYPLGPVTGRTLFAWHAHRLLAAQAKHGSATPFYVMTSLANEAATREVFVREGFFGLRREDVFFFRQDMLPALDSGGRVLFESRDRLFLAPNGHGGSLLGLARSGALADMRARGVEVLSYFQVDNPLVRPADPLFLGLHAQAGAEMSSKVVDKRDARERVGVIGRIDGALGCIEYSDLPGELREAREPGGRLRFRAGNIAAHLFDIPFLESLTGARFGLPWHVARKTMRVADESGDTRECEGFKFETFVFDALAYARRSVTLEVERSLEFCPVKNREGEDSPATARAALCAMFASWVRRAGRPLPPLDASGNVPVEVDPRHAETQDEFLRRGGAPIVHPTGHVYGA